MLCQFLGVYMYIPRIPSYISHANLKWKVYIEDPNFIRIYEET